jgi:hypothetical protein
VRAYSRAAEAVLSRVPLRTVVLTRRFIVEHAYELSHAVAGFLSASGLAPSSSEYRETVRLVFDVPLSRVADFEAGIRDRTAGRARIEELPSDQNGGHHNEDTKNTKTRGESTSGSRPVPGTTALENQEDN